ncbi:hypothetical protein DOTSEDRAFT_74844, partial [Dothistroma septosporum NZE10]
TTNKSHQSHPAIPHDLPRGASRPSNHSDQCQPTPSPRGFARIDPQHQHPRRHLTRPYHQRPGSHRRKQDLPLQRARPSSELQRPRNPPIRRLPDQLRPRRKWRPSPEPLPAASYPDS